jgi:hypothetical protein
MGLEPCSQPRRDLPIGPIGCSAERSPVRDVCSPCALVYCTHHSGVAVGLIALNALLGVLLSVSVVCALLLQV